MPRDHRNKNIEYTDTQGPGDLEKVTAHLRGKDSEIYTKLLKKLDKLEKLEKEVSALKKEVKAETKQHIVELFDADDACRTRVVETVSVIMTLTKDPKPVEGYKYGEILKELEDHLTPSLTKVLAEIRDRYKTTTQRAPSLSYHGVMPESTVVREGLLDGASLVFQRLAREFSQFKTLILAWGERYDRRLARVQDMLGEL